VKTLEGRPLDFPTLGWLATSWIEHYCVRGPGPVQGQPVELTDEDVTFLCWLYRLYPADHELAGKRVATDADLSAPKGWAKSELAGFVVLWEAFGPCRFVGWAGDSAEQTHWGYTFEAGEPVGRTLQYPFIRCLATEEEQSGNTYRNVKYVLDHGERISADYSYDVGLTRTFILEASGGEIRPSTSGDASKDGGLETLTVCDETHLYLLALKTMYDTVDRNCRKREMDEPLLLRTTTMFSPGEGSVAEDMWAVFESVDKDPERALFELGILVDHREAPEDLDITDDAALEAGLRDVYGDKQHIVDIRNMIRVNFRRPGADIPNARRYFLNQRVKASGKWISAVAYDRRRSSESMKPRDRIALGFDGSKTQDATGFVGSRLADGLLDVLGYWERPPKLKRWEEWEVPSEDVHARLAWIVATYDVVALFADPHWWRQEVDTWHGQWPDVVTRFDTSKSGRMVYAVDRMETGIAAGSDTAPGSWAVRFSPHPALRRHFLNAYAVPTKIKLEGSNPPKFGRVIAKETRDSRDLIDLAAAAVLAEEGRGWALSNGLLVPEAPAEFHTF
jgi:hypothetical protein